jgi:hypothetical protein
MAARVDGRVRIDNPELAAKYGQSEANLRVAESCDHGDSARVAGLTGLPKAQGRRIPA